MIEIPEKIRDEIAEYAYKEGLTESQKAELLAKVRSLYSNVRYDREEAVGVVTAQSLSEPATQMSLDAKEKVIIKRGDMISITEIGQFVDIMLEKIAIKESDGWEISDVSGLGIFVPSITQDEKIVWKRVLAVSRHSSPEKLIKINTASGRQIVATDCHSFIVRKENRIVPIAGKDLKCGDRIPVIRYLPENCVQSIETSFIETKGPTKLNLDEELGWLFGIYLAKGKCTPNYVSISSTDPIVISQLRAFASKYGLTFNEYDNYRGFARSHDIRINCIQLSTLLSSTCGTDSRNKRIPFFAWSAEHKFVSGLLRGYFDGDGNVTRKSIRISSNSKQLIDGVAILLARFGIFATKGKGKQYTLTIPHTYAGIFKETIGFSVLQKAARLTELCSLPSKQELDMIPGFGTLLKTVCQKLGYPTRYVNNFTRNQIIGRQSMIRYIHLFDRLAKEKNIDISRELLLMKQMAYSDVVWDRIESIEYVTPSTPYVYDFTVEGTETFTTFEGIITHNTMRTYHFAGTAGIQVTLGLPRLLEIFDAKRELETPTMTIYIKKDFQNDLEKIKKIAENIKEIKIKDIILSTVIDLAELSIICKLDTKKLNDLDIDIEKAVKSIKLRNAEITVNKGELILKTKKRDIKGISKLKFNLLDCHIKGIKGITQAVITKEGDEWVIKTLGSNLKKVLEIEGIDPTRTVSNNIFEIEEVFGIEAARNAIVQQTQYTMEEQGLHVDIRYILLLADLMTASGQIRAIGRYGISGQKASVLVRASFEETKRHLTTAAVTGEIDKLAGTIENIMMNQVAPIGTGVFQLKGDIPSLEQKK
jgi:DNA-directed RNA polymerase subunit A"